MDRSVVFVETQTFRENLSYLAEPSLIALLLALIDSHDAETALHNRQEVDASSATTSGLNRGVVIVWLTCGPDDDDNRLRHAPCRTSGMRH